MTPPRLIPAAAAATVCWLLVVPARDHLAAQMSLNFDAHFPASGVDDDNWNSLTADATQNFDFGGDVSLEDVTSASTAITKAYRFTGGVGDNNGGTNSNTWNGQYGDADGSSPAASATTWEFWIKPSDTGDANQVILESGGSGTGFSIWYAKGTDSDGSGTINFTIDGGSEQATVSAIIDTTDFRQVVLVYNNNASGNTDSMEIYVDGVFVDDNLTITSGDAGGNDLNHQGLNDYCGGDGTGLGNANNSHAQGTPIDELASDAEFEGDIAIFRVWGLQALTANRIYASYISLTQSPVFAVDASLDTDGDDRWEDIVAGNPSGAEFLLDQDPIGEAVTRVAITGSNTTFTHAYNFVGGLIEDSTERGALMVNTGTTGGVGAETLGWDQQDVAVEIWFRPDNIDPTSTEGQILWETGGLSGLGFVINNNELILSHDDDIAGSTISYNLADDLSDLLAGNATSEFIQAVAVFQPTTDNLELFINGISVGTATVTDDDWSGGDVSALGTRGGNNTGGFSNGSVGFNPYDGEIAMMRVYLYDIPSAAEILASFDSLMGPDVTPPSITGTDPADEAPGVFIGTILTATFDEDIALANSGTITLNGADVRTINLDGITSDDGEATVNGNVLTITLDSNLNSGFAYDVIISNGAILDLADTPNAFGGTMAGDWNFTAAAANPTPPTITTYDPADGSTNLSTSSAIVATFDQAILLSGSGTIVIQDLNLGDGDSSVTIDLSNLPDPGGSVTVLGNVLTINLANPLQYGENYAVQISSDAIVNFTDVAFAGIADTTTWNFSPLAAVWFANSGGNWSDTTKWDSGIIADGTDDSAFFQTEFTGNRTVTLDTPRTLGNLSYTDTTPSHNLTINSNVLTLDVTSGSPEIEVAQAGRTVQINSQISGSDGFTKSGPGRLIVNNNNNNYTGDTVVSGGILQIGTAFNSGNTSVPGGYNNANPPAGSSNLELNNGQVSYWFSFNRTLGTGDGQLQLTGGTCGFTQRQGDRVDLTLGSSSTEVVWGSPTFNPSTLVLNEPAAGPAAPIRFNNPIDLNGADRTVATNSTSSTTNTGVYGRIIGTGAQLNGNIRNTSGTAAGLIKTGPGILALDDTNTYNGGTTINQGGILFDRLISMPASGNVLVNDGALLLVSLGNSGEWTEATSGIGSFGGLLAGDGGQAAAQVTYNGDVTLGVNVTEARSFAGNIPDVTGSTSTGFSLYSDDGGGSITLSGNNSYTGTTTVFPGTTLTADSSTALGTGGNISFRGGTLRYTAASAVADFSTGGRIVNSNSAMRFNTNGQNVSLADVIDSSNTAGLVKSGGGILELSGANAFGGNITVSGGTLLSSSAGALNNRPIFIRNATLHALGAGATGTGAIDLGGSSIDAAILLQQDGGASIANSIDNAGRSSDINIMVDRETAGDGSADSWTLSNAPINIANNSTVTWSKGPNITSGTPTINHSSALTSSESIGTAALTYIADGVNLQVNGHTNTRGRNFTFNANTPGNEIYGRIDQNGTGGDRIINCNFTGTGTWNISSSNSDYTGTTTVSGGTLLISGGIPTTGAVNVSGPGILGGGGNIGNATSTPAVTVDATGGLAPGNNAAGTLSIDGSLDISAVAGGGLSNLAFELDALASTSDQIAVTGALNIGTDALRYSDFNFTDLGGLEAGTYTLISSGTLNGTLDADNSSGVIGNFNATLQVSGNNLVLNVVPRPYETWAATFLPGADVSDRTGNNDTDDMRNLLEFAFGTDPTVNDQGRLTWDGSDFTYGGPNISTTSAGNGVNFKARFIRRTDRGQSGSVNYVWRFSSDMTVWEDSDDNPDWYTEPFVLDTQGNYQLVEVVYPFFLDSFKKARFFQVEVTAVP